MQSDLGKLALSYAKQGFHVFPVAPGSKFPLSREQLGIPKGQPAGLSLATLDKEKIRAWWEEFPDANIGIRTGAVSGITVVDLDGQEGRDNFYAQAKPGDDLLTFTVRTPSGGCHLYYQYNPKLGQTAAMLGKDSGIDIRNDGGYVLAPGSVLSDGAGEYEVEVDGGFATLPEWILSLQEKKVRKHSAPATGAGIGEGGRNDSLTRIAGALRRQGIEAAAIAVTLRSLNEELCDPPLEDEEVERIASSVSRYEADEEQSIENTRPIPAVELVKPMCDFLRDPNKVRGTSTGIDELDKLLGGGYRGGEVVAIHAPAKTGKSTLLRKLVHSLVKRGVKSGYATREEYADREVLPQLLSIELGRSVLKSEVDQGLYEETLKDWPLYFAPGYGKFPAFGRWLENCKEAGCEVVFVDHLHFMTKDEDYNEAVRVMHEAVKLAKSLDLCVVMVIQPKGLQEGQELGLATLRGGAAIGQAITVLITMERVKEQKNISRIRVAAKRSPLARLGDFHLQLDEESLDMVEVEFSPDDDHPKPPPQTLPGSIAEDDDTPLFDRSIERPRYSTSRLGIPPSQRDLVELISDPE